MFHILMNPSKLRLLSRSEIQGFLDFIICYIFYCKDFSHLIHNPKKEKAYTLTRKSEKRQDIECTSYSFWDFIINNHHYPVCNL